MENNNCDVGNKDHFNEYLTEITFVNLSVSEEVIFDDKKPVLILVDILKPVVKLENCTWLEEFWI